MNPHDSGRFCTESLISAAKRYKTLGFSLIPLLGARFPQRAKQPAIRWARYQHTPPTEEELHNWFCEEQYSGLGVVCGRVSGLLVLDFDDACGASEFRRSMPDFTQTYTVRSGTRGLPHFYYRLPPGHLVSTQSFGKVDLRGEGSYVVAPPTVVGDAFWSVESDRELKSLSQADLRRLLAYLKGVSERVRKGGLSASNPCGGSEASEFRHFAVEEEYTPSLSVGDDLCVVPFPPPGLPASNPDVQAEASEFRHLSADDLIACYQQSVVVGRNRALFKAGCVARDAGWLEQAVVVVLAPVHTLQLGSGDEHYDMRYAEAVRTIASVYSRPPRRTISRSSSVVSNALREWLMAHDLVAAARVLDGLYMAGMKAGDLFTERQACEVLTQFGIGRRSVMAALQSECVSGRPVFGVADGAAMPPLNPPSQANAASDWERLNNSCEMSRGAKRVKSVATGRKPRLYRLPDIGELTQALGLNPGGGDALQPDELSSPKVYRQALHCHLFERRPGQYGRRWLAARLGVSRWTTRRYEQAAHVYRQPVYAAHALDWHTAQSMLPETMSEAGLFIEDAEGKRYPALRAIAFKLLKAGKKVFCRRQEANYFAAQQPSVGIPTLHNPGRVLMVTNPEVRQQPGRLPRERPKATLLQSLSVGIPTLHDPGRGLAAPNPEAGRHPGRSLRANPEAIPPQSSSVGIPTLQPVDHDNLPNQLAFWLCPECLNTHISEQAPAVCRCGQQAAWEQIPESIWRDTELLKQWWQRRWQAHRAHLKQQVVPPVAPKHTPRLTDPAAEACARRLPAMVANLSLTTARNLIIRYGLALVEQGVRILKARDNIHNPAGFLVSLLRSEYKFYTKGSNQSVSHTATNYYDWVQRMGQSAYVSFLANADDFRGVTVNA